MASTWAVVTVVQPYTLQSGPIAWGVSSSGHEARHGLNGKNSSALADLEKTTNFPSALTVVR